MKIYRKVIPKIAKDVVRALLAGHMIEVEDGHRDEAELDVAGVMVEYMNLVDKLNNDARDALQRHNLGIEHLGRVKKGLADSRNIVLGDEALDHVLGRMVESLFNSKHIEEVFGEDNELRAAIHAAMPRRTTP
jgi:hypothetical protein